VSVGISKARSIYSRLGVGILLGVDKDSNVIIKQVSHLVSNEIVACQFVNVFWVIVYLECSTCHCYVWIVLSLAMSLLVNLLSAIPSPGRTARHKIA